MSIHHQLSKTAARRLLGEFLPVLPPLSGPQRKVAILLAVQLGEDRARAALAIASEEQRSPLPSLLASLTRQERRAFDAAARDARRRCFPRYT